MDANPAEVVTQPPFEERARAMIERLTRHPQHIVNNGRRQRSRGGVDVRRSLQELLLLITTAARSAAAALALQRRTGDSLSFRLDCVLRHRHGLAAFFRSLAEQSVPALAHLVFLEPQPLIHSRATSAQLTTFSTVATG